MVANLVRIYIFSHNSARCADFVRIQKFAHISARCVDLVRIQKFAHISARCVDLVRIQKFAHISAGSEFSANSEICTPLHVVEILCERIIFAIKFVICKVNANS